MDRHNAGTHMYLPRTFMIPKNRSYMYCAHTCTCTVPNTMPLPVRRASSFKQYCRVMQAWYVAVRVHTCTRIALFCWLVGASVRSFHVTTAVDGLLANRQIINTSNDLSWKPA